MFGFGNFLSVAGSRMIDDRSGAVALLIMETPAFIAGLD